MIETCLEISSGSTCADPTTRFIDPTSHEGMGLEIDMGYEWQGLSEEGLTTLTMSEWIDENWEQEVRLYTWRCNTSVPTSKLPTYGSLSRK
jgi:hypothetical protein